MISKILITGSPGSGKSTLISKLIEYYTTEKNYSVYGFLTPEVRDQGNRVGFDIIDIYSGNRFQFARVGNLNTKYQVGRYNVFIEEFNNYIKNFLSLEGKDIDLIVIDEIGKMELGSQKFQKFLKILFKSKISILATIGLKMKHPVKNFLINLPSVLLLRLNRGNSQLISKKIISLIP